MSVRLVHEHHPGVAVAEDDGLVDGGRPVEHLPDAGQPVAEEVARQHVRVGDARGLDGAADGRLGRRDQGPGRLHGLRAVGVQAELRRQEPLRVRACTNSAK